MKLKTVILLACLCALPVMSHAQQNYAYGNITAASASCLSTNCVTLQLDSYSGAATIQLSGTFSGTEQFEVSSDNGSNYTAILGAPIGGGAAVSSSTATGSWQFAVGGYTHIRVRGSAYTSGTAAVVINSAKVSARLNPLSSGGTFASDVFFKSGRPWFDVQAFGAANDVSFQSAITAAAAAGGGTVFVSAGAYSIASTVSVSARTNVAILFDANATLTATAGLGANPILQISNGSTLIHVWGPGHFIGASIASNCISVAGSSTARVWIYDIECSGTTTQGIDVRGSDAALGTYDIQDVFIGNVYVHDTGNHGISCKQTKNFNLVNSRIGTTTAGSGVSVGCEGGAVTGNNISGWSTAASSNSAIHSFASTNFHFDGNTTVGSASDPRTFAVYDDTGFFNTHNGNTINGGWGGLRCEVNRGCVMNGNTVNQSLISSGGTLFVNSRVDSLQKNAYEVTTGLVAGSNVTLTADNADFQEGANSLQAVLGGGFTTGLVYSEVFGSTQDWSLRPIIRLWVKSSLQQNNAVYQLQLFSDAALTNQIAAIDLPYLAAATWSHLELFDLEWYPKFVTPGVRGYKIVANSAPGASTLHFDDLKLDVPDGPNTISNNNVARSKAAGIQAETLHGFTISGNIIDDAGYGNNAGGNGSGIFFGAGNLNATAGQTETNGQIFGNIVRGSYAVLSSTGLRGRFANAATGNDLYVHDNDVSLNIATPTSFDSAGNIVNYRNIAGTTQTVDNCDQVSGGNGATNTLGCSTELLTIAAAANTDSTTNLLPANSIIESVVVRVVTTIPTAATFTVGDATIAARFATGVAVAANTTAVGLTHVDQTGTSGPKQVSAAKVRITPNLSPGAATGVVRITVFYRQFVPPTS